MVQTLVIEEVKAPTDTYSATITVDGAANDGTKVTVSSISAVERGDSMSFTVTPKEGITVKAVTANGKTLTAVSGVYTITNVTRNQTINIITEGTVVARYTVTVANNQNAYVTIDNVPVVASTVSLTSGLHEVVVDYPANTPEYLKGLTFDGGTVMGPYSNGLYRINVTSAGTLTVGKLSVALNVDASIGTGVKLGNTSLNNGDQVPVGATVTMTPAAGLGTWNETGSKQFTNTTEFKVGEDGSVDASEYGWFKLEFSTGDVATADKTNFVKVSDKVTVHMESGDWDNTDYMSHISFGGTNWTGVIVSADENNNVTFEVQSISADVTDASISWR